MKKIIISLLVLALSLAVLSQIGVETCTASTYLLVPEFTVEFVDNSYDIPPSYSINQFTGANVTEPGRHVVDRSIKIVIKNQHHAPSDNLYFDIRYKGPYGTD